MAAEEAKVRLEVDSWDWPTRWLHWINALIVLALALLMVFKLVMESLGVPKPMRAPVKTVHAYLGHVFLITFSFRLIWAFIGPKYARWSDIFPFSAEKRGGMVRTLKWYLSGFKGDPGRYAGHDPLASLFYLALFAVLVMQAATGVVLSGAELSTFPGTVITGGMDKAAVEALAEALEEAHEFGFFFIIFFIAAHLFGLVAHDAAEKTGLFSSMISGKKYFPEE